MLEWFGNSGDYTIKKPQNNNFCSLRSFITKGESNCKKGLALKPVPIARLNQTLFKERIAQLTNNNAIKINCKIMAEKLASENGVDNAVKLIEQGI